VRWRERGRGTATSSRAGGNGNGFPDRGVSRSHLNTAGYHHIAGDFASAFVHRAGDISRAAGRTRIHGTGRGLPDESGC
jgi:hypothetical protein